MGKCSDYHPASKSLFRQKVDIAPLCCQPSMITGYYWRFSSLKITDRSFRYASPRLWNQLPDSVRQPRQSRLDSPPHSLVSSSLSSSPISSSITLSLLAQNLPFQHILPMLILLPLGCDDALYKLTFTFTLLHSRSWDRTGLVVFLDLFLVR